MSINQGLKGDIVFFNYLCGYCVFLVFIMNVKWNEGVAKYTLFNVDLKSRTYGLFESEYGYVARKIIRKGGERRIISKIV